MGLLINGDIYIKTKPDIINQEKQIQQKQEQLHEIDFEEAHNGITEETEHMREIIEKELEILDIGKPVYDYTDSFHILKIAENGMEIYNYDRIGHKRISKCDIKELKEKYIRLMDFLKEATYIGKEFIRTVPIIKEEGQIDTSYWNQAPYESTTILYKTDYAMLAHYKDQHTNNLEMINPQYFIDGKYKLIGNKNRIYEDKKETYKEIVDEIENRYQYYKKYYKNK